MSRWGPNGGGGGGGGDGGAGEGEGGLGNSGITITSSPDTGAIAEPERLRGKSCVQLIKKGGKASRNGCGSGITPPNLESERKHRGKNNNK